MTIGFILQILKSASQPTFICLRYLMMMGDLTQPALYLSLFFKNNRQTYYDRLAAVREAGDWEGWLEFYLTGIADTSTQVVETSKAISDLIATDIARIGELKRAGITARKVHDRLSHKAILSAKQVAHALDVSPLTARTALKNLKELGIVKDVRGRGKERLYIYDALIEILDKGTEPINY